MGPEIEIHRDVAIRYGYSIRDDIYYAHYDLPEKQQQRGGFQQSVRMDLSPRTSPGKYHVTAQSADEAVLKAKTKIDDYFEE